MTEPLRPRVRLLSDENVAAIVEEAYDVLEKVGVEVEHAEAVELLQHSQAEVSDDGRRVFVPRELVRQCLESVPQQFSLFGRGGAEVVVGGDHTHFDPGSAALTLYDVGTGRIRAATTRDVVEFAVITEGITPYDCQSTGLVPSDVPELLADRYRLLVALVYGKKPIITGTFTREAFATMHAMLCAVRGGEGPLRDRPLAIFDCCPTAPLAWSELTCDALVSCARTGVPAETVSMPLAGATAPVTLAGSIVQHTAESLSGLVIHQLAGPGAPFVYGGAPSCFDMRKATTPMGSVETMMIDASYAQVGQYLGLPTHAYMGLSDAKLPDYQAGMETALGVVMAALAGVNVVSGPGMLNFVGTQSLEKLVLDGEICAMAKRLLAGVTFRGWPEALEILSVHALDKSFLTAQHTRQHFREEAHFPGGVIDRGSQGDWESANRPDAIVRARDEVSSLLASTPIEPPDDDLIDELESIILADARALGVDSLPDWRVLLR